jgi:hypothetical protein
MRARVFIAGPYTGGDVAANVARAIGVADDLAAIGFAPFVPHLNHFWHMIHPHTYGFWLDLDNQFLALCEAVLRISGDSPGADAEVERAARLGIPVFSTVEDLDRYFSPQIPFPRGPR